MPAEAMYFELQSKRVRTRSLAMSSEKRLNRKFSLKSVRARDICMHVCMYACMYASMYIVSVRHFLRNRNSTTPGQFDSSEKKQRLREKHRISVGAEAWLRAREDD